MCPMDSEVDLSELDDWLGTLEELQLGLERNKTAETSGQPPNANAALERVPSPFSHVNQAFLSEPLSPRHHVHPPPWELNKHFDPAGIMGLGSPTRLPLLNPPLTTEQRQKSISSCCVRASHLPSKIAPQTISPRRIVNGREQMDHSFSGRNIKEATAERDLSCLLRDLELVEQRMKELEQSGNTFTRRYSLASSPSTQQSSIATLSQNLQTNDIFTDGECVKCQKPGGGSGFISAQWAAEINRDGPVTSTHFSPTTSAALPLLPLSTSRPALATPPLPPAYLGAGDACVSTPNSPQPLTSTTTIQIPREAGLWFTNNNPTQYSCDSTVGPNDIGRGVDYGQSVHRSDFATNSSLHGPFPHIRQPVATTIKSLGEKSTTWIPDTRHVGNAHYYRENGSSHPPNSAQLCALPSSDSTNTPDRVPPEKTPCDRNSDEHHHVVMVNAVSHGHSNSLVSKDVDEDSSLSEYSSCSRGIPSAGCNSNKVHSFTPRSNHLFNTLSPESSLSGNSLPEHPLCNQPARSPWGSMDASLVKKLVVRIFRPDRTTKAIAIEEHLTAGEVASMLIEKNFLKPSTSLAVVEKVPALKVERVFEEHEKVAECVSSWPSGSQNMIFFEERKDLFGFIESPGLWLGEEFTELHRYNSADAVQHMLNNLEQTGFPEWKDYLYIRKPGEKTWSRRLCVLRSSGIYTSRKNKKSLSSADLIRILVFDEKLQLYTTTGGWTRLRAPTPHGFAFKPYSAQDPASTNVFCFCATDDKSLRHWICRLRIAKYGRQLYVNYQNALERIQRLQALRYASASGSNNLNGSLSACVQRKSSFDIISNSTSTALSASERSGSLSLRAGSPALERRNLVRQANCVNNRPTVSPRMDLSFSVHPTRCPNEADRSVSPLPPRTHPPCLQPSVGANSRTTYE